MRKKYVILTIFLVAILGIVGGFVKNHYDKKRLEDDVYTYLEDHNVSKNEVSSLNKVYDKGRKPPEKNQIRVSLKRDSDVDYYFYRNKSGKIVLDYATKNGEEVDLKDVPL